MPWKNQFGTGTFETFVMAFFEGTALTDAFPNRHYMNRRVIIPNIRPNVNAEIRLSENGISENYSCFVVTVVHKDNGEIARQTFTFDDYLKLPESHGDRNQGGVVLIAYCGKDWHCDGPTPESVRNLAARIAEYIKLYACKFTLDISPAI